MRLRISSVIVFFLVGNVAAQDAGFETRKHGTMTVRKVDTEIYKVVDQMPVFPGGNLALNRYLASTPYPVDMLDAGISGTVYVQFVVTPSGNVISPVIIRSDVLKSGGEAVLTMVKNMPVWQPGYQRGQAVYVQMVAPVYFRTK